MNVLSLNDLIVDEVDLGDPESMVAESVVLMFESLADMTEGLSVFDRALYIQEMCTDIHGNVTVEGVAVDVHVGDPFEGFKLSLKNTFIKIANAIKEFFKSIIYFFKNKILGSDTREIKKYLPFLTDFYNSSEQLYCKMSGYRIDDPIGEYLKDRNLLENSIPNIGTGISELTRELRSYSPTFFEKIGYMTGGDELSKKIEDLKNEMFTQLLSHNTNFKLVNENTITSDVKRKYFGENPIPAEQLIRSIIPSVDIYTTLISNETYDRIRRLRDNCEQYINHAMHDISAFDASAPSDSITSAYNFIRSRINTYRSLLSLLLRVSILYWDLYSIFRKDCMASARVIYKSMSHK